METLDRCFENVCELDLIFHVDKVHNILQEVCMGGMVLETNMTEILIHVDAQNKVEKSEASPTSAIRVSEIKLMMFTQCSGKSDKSLVFFIVIGMIMSLHNVLS